MLSSFHHIRPVSAFFLGVFLAAQVLLVAGALAIPAPAKATYPNVEIASVYKVLKDIAIGVAKGFAQQFINQYLIKFVNKVTEKYKIRNFLYYDQVLTNYYLTNFISDKVSDPDLRRIYSLLNAAYITGEPTGATGYDPRDALIPQLRTAISNYYIKSGGVNPDTITNPPVGMTNYQYFDTAYRYYLDPPSFTEVKLRGQYGAFQSNATTAAQLEVIVGSGLKAGRFVGGTCSFVGPLQQGQTLPQTPDACAAMGGAWTASALDQARAFIDNPSSFVNSWMDKGILKIMDGNYDPNNIWSQVGAALGSFIYNRLFLNQQGGVLTEDPRPYVPDPGIPNNGTPVDIDGDGVNDGIDTNNDGQPDICTFGGANGPTGPPCKGSAAAVTPPPTEGEQECASGTAVEMQAMAEYEDDLDAAIAQALADHPTEANTVAPNDDDPALVTIMDAVIQNLQDAGFDRVGRIANCSSGRTSYDAVMVAHSTDTFPVYGGLGEIYDIFRGAPLETVGQRATSMYIQHGDFGRLR